MRPLSSNRNKLALLFLGAMLIGFNAIAQPECRDIGGIRYCNIEYWIGMSTLVGEERMSSLPSGEVAITERNHCPPSFKGGYLATLQQNVSIFSNATLVDGETWGELPPNYPIAIERQATGQSMSSALPNIQLFGQTVTYKNIFSPAMHYYTLQCTYNDCTEFEPALFRCGREITYLIGINMGSTSAVDLALGPISITGANISENGGLPIIPVGVQTQVNVPVSINFVGALPSNILNSSVLVTLQVGSFSSTQNIPIASLVANQNQMLVPFLVTFQSNDAGLKTLIASVNAERSISESNFSNNEAQLNVRVGEKYRIVKEITIDDVSNTDSSRVNMSPSKENGCGSPKKSIARIKIWCVKEMNGSTVDEVVSGCSVRTSLGLGDFLGGHGAGPDEHYAGHDQTKRPIGDFLPNTNSGYVVIPKSGLDVRYTAPEVSGEYVTEFKVNDPFNNAIEDVLNTSFRVETQTPFVSFKAVPGLEFHKLNSHPGDMFWGRPAMRTRVAAAIKKYFNKANSIPAIRGNLDPELDPFDNPNISLIYSQGVSLRAGGLFDVARLFKYTSAGHCYHRKGIDIDFSLSTFNNSFSSRLKYIWATSIRRSDLVMEIPAEQPELLTADHWHATLILD